MGSELQGNTTDAWSTLRSTPPFETMATFEGRDSPPSAEGSTMSTVGNGGSPRRKTLVLCALIFGILGAAALAALHARTTALKRNEAPKETSEAIKSDGPPPPHPGDDDIILDEKLYEWSPPTKLPDATK